MSFTPQQIEDLSAPLNRKHVKSRSQAGRNLSYIEGWHAIAEANRIFGFDGWDRETVELRECGEPRQTGDKWRVAFMCRVRVRVRCGTLFDGAAIVRDGTGYGSGIDKDLGQAYESAIKEAETDAMKRALMTFGNPFGLALYDKDQANVVDDSRPRRQSDRHIVEDEPQDQWDGPELTKSQEMAEGMMVALRKRIGASAVEAFLNHPKVKADLDALDMDEFTLVMRVASEQRALEAAKAAS